MKAVIRDASTLRAVGLSDLVAYLRAHGWTEAEPSGHNASIWCKRAGVEGRAEILVPKSEELRDYARRIAEIVSVLENIEKKSQLQIVRDLSLASADVVRVRHPAGPDEEDSIPISDGVALVLNAKNLLAAAAATTVRPKRVLPPRRPNQAIEYMRNVRLGHTEHGSYVFTLISRVAPLLTQATRGLLELMEPFPRQATRTLSQALRSTKAAAAQAASTGSFEAFEESVAAGVSANFCDSIVGMARSEQGTHPVAIELFWAPTRPVDDDLMQPVVFRQDSIEIIEEAARLFREEGPYEDVPITGVVVKLQRDSDNIPGTATVACVIEGKSRQLSVQLDGDEYHLAVTAHDKMCGVFFEADIARDGLGFRASRVRDLRLVDS